MDSLTSRLRTRFSFPRVAFAAAAMVYMPGPLLIRFGLPLAVLLGADSLGRVTRGHNPMISNGFADDTRRRLANLGIGLVVAVMVIVSFDGWVVWAAGAALLGYAAWRYPPMIVAVLVYASATTGASWLLLAAPVTVLIARRWHRRELAIPRSVIYSATSLVWALMAFMLTLPFLSMTVGGGGSGDGPESASDSTLAELIRRILGLEREPGQGYVFDENGLPVRPIEPPPPDEPRDVPWLWVLIIVGTVVLVGIAVWLYRRRRQAGTGPALALARLEAVGRHLGQPRRSDEGAISYSDRLAAVTGDTRLRDTGDLVSGEIYESVSIDPNATEHELVQLEAAPPELDRVPIGLRVRRTGQRLTPRALRRTRPRSRR